ncbi:MAG: hypothetical protein ABEJ07_03925 [Candidatus Nanohaloarchaea archaeon]
MREDLHVTSDLSDITPGKMKGSRVAVGFRPSGELHVGNLLSIAYAAVIASELDLELDLMCCDTDWSAHIHEQHMPGESDVMRLFFMRDCPCNRHDDIAEHRVEEIEPFLRGLERETSGDATPGYLSDLRGDEGYNRALREVLENMEQFDRVFGGGFRRRYVSPVVPVCDGCGNSHAKGAAYSHESRELVAACRNPDCHRAFIRGSLEDEIGVYYLVDPVRDVSRDVAVHVFGGDYRVAEKEQKTSKVAKVAKLTELATGETPAYFLAPMTSDSEGKPLSKSKGTGRTVSDIENLEGYGRELAEKVLGWLEEEKKHVQQSNI